MVKCSNYSNKQRLIKEEYLKSQSPSQIKKLRKVRMCCLRHIIQEWENYQCWRSDNICDLEIALFKAVTIFKQCNQPVQLLLSQMYNQSDGHFIHSIINHTSPILICTTLSFQPLCLFLFFPFLLLSFAIRILNLSLA